MPKARKLEPLEPNGQIESDGLTTGIVVPVVGGHAGTWVKNERRNDSRTTRRSIHADQTKLTRRHQENE